MAGGEGTGRAESHLAQPTQYRRAATEQTVRAAGCVPPAPQRPWLSVCFIAAGYLCPLTANVYGIDFLSFKVRDMETNKELFCIARVRVHRRAHFAGAGR